jgi:hypothetical protein
VRKADRIEAALPRRLVNDSVGVPGKQQDHGRPRAGEHDRWRLLDHPVVVSAKTHVEHDHLGLHLVNPVAQFNLGQRSDE